MGKEISKWADEAMFTAEESNAAEGPKVYLLHINNDPLGSVAACAKMYKGEVVRDLDHDVTDEERVHYLQEIQKTKLAMPLEAVTLHFMIEGVTRAFTHQMVRQRTAAYAQESMRFAVKEDMATAVALPAHLAAVKMPKGWDWLATEGAPEEWEYLLGRLTPEQRMLVEWTRAVNGIAGSYNKLIALGMPAEDARGLAPTNITTRLNYITNLRNLLDHSGNRLCTQAQFEWRLVFAKMAEAIREYKGPIKLATAISRFQLKLEPSWQLDAIAGLFKPVCYQTGKCAFKADFDRYCSIRDRVDTFEEYRVPSHRWSESVEIVGPEMVHKLLPISPAEWLLDPGSARRKMPTA